MAQESYADFSIIQKFLDQKKHHDEEVRKYKSRIEELEGTLVSLKNESEAKDQAIIQLQSQIEEGKTALQEKERMIQELSIQIHRLKKQLEQTQQEKRSEETEDNNEIKKAKFSFLKK